MLSNGYYIDPCETMNAGFLCGFYYIRRKYLPEQVDLAHPMETS